MKEFTAVSTPDELIICIEIDGKITKSYERRRISDDEVEVYSTGTATGLEIITRLATSTAFRRAQL